MKSLSSLMWPPLRERHPGYFKVSIALILFHIFTAVNEFAVDHDKNHFWDYTRWSVGGHMEVWAVLHLVCVSTIIAGLYGRFPLARFGFGLSLFIGNVFTVTGVFAVIQFRYLTDPPEPFTFAYPIATLVISLCSLAALNEPQDGPRAPCDEAKAHYMMSRT